MMYLYEELKDKALQLIDMKSTEDDIKAGRDLALINDVMNKVTMSPKYINDGISLDIILNKDYLEIQLLRDAANTMKNVLGINVDEIAYKTPQECIVDDLTTDCFGILVSVLIKHQIIFAIKDFIRAVD